MEVLPKKILSVIHPKKFNLDNSGGYHLAINTGPDVIKICCIEHVSKECLWLSVYKIPLDKQQPDYIKCLEQLYNEDFFLIKKDWRSVTLSISNQKCTLVPHLLLSTKDLSTYLHVACGVDPSDTVASFTHPLAKVSLVFSETTAVVDWFRKRYTSSNFHIIHQANALIEGFQLECPMPSKPTWLIWLDQNYVHIVVRHKTQLLYYNSFVYETAHDFLSCLSAVRHVLKLKNSDCMVWVGGLIEKNSLAYRGLKNCMPRMSLKNRLHFMHPRMLVFQTMQCSPMVYFDLMSSFLCHPHVPYSKH